jgi:hypothetical protein
MSVSSPDIYVALPGPFPEYRFDTGVGSSKHLNGLLGYPR